MRVLMFGWEFPPHVSGGLGTACYGMTHALASRGTDILFVLPCLLSAPAEPAEPAGQGRKEQTATSPSPPEAPVADIQKTTPQKPEGSTTLQGVGTIPATSPVSTSASTLVSAPAPAPAPMPAPAPALGRITTEAAAARRLQLMSASSVFSPDGGFTQAAEVSRQVNRQVNQELGYEHGHEHSQGKWEEHVRVHPVGSSLFAYATPESYQQRIWETSTGSRSEVGSQPGGSTPFSGASPSFFDQGHAGSDGGFAGAPHDGSSCGTGDGTGGGYEQPYTLKGGYGPDLMTEVYRFGEAAGAIALREQFDVIHVHDWMTYPAGMAAKRLTGKPLVAHIHATEYDRSGLNINREVARIEQAGMLAADRVVAVSHYTRELIMRRYGIPADKISVVHNAVARSEAPAAYHVPEGCENEKRVLFMGRVTYQKGPEYFVEAAHLVLRRMPGVRFVMAGSGDMLSRMVRRVAQLRMGSRFHFTGFLKGGMVDQMYATSDLYVMPSVSEPFGIAPLEAMVYDTPVLLSRQSGVAEVVKNALKVDFWDIREMANKICAVLAYPRLAAAVVSNCREELKSIKWENSADLLNAIYRNVCARRD